MIRATLSVLVLFAGLHTAAQVKMFASYDDWKADKPSATYKNFRGWGHTFGVPRIFVWDDVEVKEMTIGLKDIWGFTVDGVLHRKDSGKRSRILKLKTEGMICVWYPLDREMDLKEMTAADFLLCISIGVGGGTVPLPHGLRGAPEARYNGFVREHREGELAPLVACLEGTKYLEPAEQCVALFNAQ